MFDFLSLLYFWFFFILLLKAEFLNGLWYNSERANLRRNSHCWIEIGIVVAPVAIASVDLETGIWPGVTAFFFCAVGWFILTVVGLTAGEYWARRPGLSVEVPDQGDSDKGAS